MGLPKRLSSHSACGEIGSEESLIRISRRDYSGDFSCTGFLHDHNNAHFFRTGSWNISFHVFRESVHLIHCSGHL